MTTLEAIKYIANGAQFETVVIDLEDDKTVLQAIAYLAEHGTANENREEWQVKEEGNILFLYSF